MPARPSLNPDKRKRPASTSRATSSRVRVRASTGTRPKSTLKRQLILDAAAKLFCERGYAAVRLEDIALEAGTQSGAMYYYFHSKEDLVEEFLKTALGPTIESLRESMAGLPPQTSYKDRIAIAMRAQLSRSLRRSNYTLAFMKIHDQVPESVQARFASYPQAYAKFWGDLLQGALDAGELRADVNLMVLRTALLGSLIGAVEWFRPGKLSPVEVAEQMASIFFNGIWRDTAQVRLPPATSSIVKLLEGMEPEAISALGHGLAAFAQGSQRAKPRRPASTRSTKAGQKE